MCTHRIRGWRLFLLALPVLLASCTTAWERHVQRVDEAEAQGNLEAALEAQRWLIDHSFGDAPPKERTTRREVDRYLKLARLASDAGNAGEALGALRIAFQTEPSRYPEILEELARVPLSPALRKRVEAEFRWNLKVLLPSVDLPGDFPLPCWSYRAREVRIRNNQVHMGLGVGERRISYDTRSWLYQAETHTWRLDGDWVQDQSAETEPVGGPPRPRYRAVVTADGGFFVEGPVPPCHAYGWTGPFDTTRNRLFTTHRLPESQR